MTDARDDSRFLGVFRPVDGRYDLESVEALQDVQGERRQLLHEEDSEEESS